MILYIIVLNKLIQQKQLNILHKLIIDNQVKHIMIVIDIN